MCDCVCGGSSVLSSVYVCAVNVCWGGAVGLERWVWSEYKTTDLVPQETSIRRNPAPIPVPHTSHLNPQEPSPYTSATHESPQSAGTQPLYQCHTRVT